MYMCMNLSLCVCEHVCTCACRVHALESVLPVCVNVLMCTCVYVYIDQGHILSQQCATHVLVGVRWKVKSVNSMPPLQ